MENIEKYWKESFDRTASEFEEDFRIAQWNKHGLDRRLAVFQKIFKNLGLANKDKIILDAGCGPGSYSILMAENGFKVLSVDYSEKMLEHARKKLSYKPNASSRIHFCVADLNYLPIKSESADLIICFGVLQYVKKERRILNEFNRVLKPSSFCILNIPNKRFLLRKNIPLFCYYDPFEFREICAAFGFECVKLWPLSLFPKPLTILEGLDKIPFFENNLWFRAHDFVMLLKKRVGNNDPLRGA